MRQTPEIRAWAERAIDTGQPGSPFSVVVLGKEAIPWIVDVAEARRSPFRAILSALTHGNEANGAQVAYAAFQGAEVLLEADRDAWQELIAYSLETAARSALEKMMNIATFKDRSVWYREGKDEGLEKGHQRGREKGREKGREEGREEGEQQALLAVLDARALVLSEAERARIVACKDTHQLLAWIRLAATVGSTAELFAASST
jgi:hypothetical protein